MAIGRGAYISKILLFVFNIVFFLAGGALLGVGIWIRVDPRTAEFMRIIVPGSTSGNPMLQNAAIVLAAVGGFICLVGFLGCCGACCNSTCMLLMYAVIVLVLAIGQIVAGILAAVFWRRVTGELSKSMHDGLVKYGTDPLLSRAWDGMHVWLECCGRNGTSDWNANSQKNPSWQADYPPSCCKLREKNPNKLTESNMLDPASCRDGRGGHNTQGCYDGLLAWLRRNSMLIIGIAFGIIVIQIVVASMACCLRSAINNDKIV